MVSIRNDIGRESFSFPAPGELKTTLADMLEEEVSDSFFLADEKVENFLRNNEKEDDEFIYRITDHKFSEDELQELIDNG